MLIARGPWEHRAGASCDSRNVIGCWLLWQLRDVEAELEAEQRRGRDVVAENRKLARLLQELRAQAEEDHRINTELADSVNTLTLKLNHVKKQLLEAVRPFCHFHST